MIDQLNDEATQILLSKGSEFIKASIEGSDAYSSLYKDMTILHCLCGYMQVLSYHDGNYYIGDQIVTWPQINSMRSKIQSYGTAVSVDFTTLPEGGTGGSGSGGSTAALPNYRTGIVASLPGTVTVQFMVNGALAPFPSTNYLLNAWNISTNGTMQHDLGTTTLTTNGFTVADVLDPGFLHYEAILLT